MRSIAAAIADHRLAPGTKLKELELAGLYGVNRAVIRGALARLAHARAIELRPNRGALVASPSLEESRQVMAARRIIETTIVQQLAGKPERATLNRLRALVKEEGKAYATGDTARALSLSIGFHRALAGLGENAVLAEFVDQLVVRTPLIVLKYHSNGRGDHHVCPNLEHVEIVAAIAAGDARRAGQLMSVHMQRIESELALERPAARPTLAESLDLGARTGRVDNAN